MAWNCGLNYDDVELAMKRMVNKPNTNKVAIMEMMAEFGEPNHLWLMQIVKILYDWDYDVYRDMHDENYTAPKLDETKIKEMGLKIHKRGGLQAMQQNYYTMKFFMNPGIGNYLDNNEDPDVVWNAKVKQIECVWSGVGDWQY